MSQTSFPDLEQMSLFAECLPDTQKKMGLEEILQSGDMSCLGSFIKEVSYKELRIELLHCNFKLPEVDTKQALLAELWSDLILQLKTAPKQALS